MIALKTKPSTTPYTPPAGRPGSGLHRYGRLIWAHQYITSHRREQLSFSSKNRRTSRAFPKVPRNTPEKGSTDVTGKLLSFLRNTASNSSEQIISCVVVRRQKQQQSRESDCMMLIFESGSYSNHKRTILSLRRYESTRFIVQILSLQVV